MNLQNLKKGAFFAAVFAELAYILFVFATNYKSPDHAEHLHASWLVWQGNVPYVDFFEHHHPLLWYLAAPLVALFYKNVMIFYVAQLVNAFVYVVMFRGLYRIACDFLKTSEKAFVLALMLFFMYPSFIWYFFEFAPDAFMFASFVWGLWYYFKFLEEKKQKPLNICFILWTISFLFLQKVLFMLLIMGGYTLYLVLKKEISLKNIIKAMIIPVIIMGIFLSYLIYHKALHQFITLNYDLNFWMCKLKGAAGFPRKTSIFLMTLWIALFCLYDFLKENSRYRLIFTGLLIGDFLFKRFTWAPWAQYFMLIEFGGLLVISQEILSLKTKKIAYLLLIFVVFMHLVAIKVNRSKYEQTYYLNLQKYVMTNSHGEDDIVYSRDDMIFNIYGKNPHYYWFGHRSIAPLAYYLYGYGGKIDINQIVQHHKPIFLIKDEMTNSLSYEGNLVENYKGHLEKIYNRFPNHGEGRENFARYWNGPAFYKIDDEIFDTYYMPAKRPHLFIRNDAPKLGFYRKK